MFAISPVLRLKVLLVAGLIAVTPLTAVSQGSTFTIIDVTGAGTGSMQGTIALAIDAAGDVTGTYLDSNRVAHGYVRTANGTISTFDAPGAGTGPPTGGLSTKNQGTIPTGINSSGVITGTYVDSNLAYHGFVRSATGTISTFDVPGVVIGSYASGTRPIGINDAGTIVGTYVDESGNYYGFIRAANGTITTLNVPGTGYSSTYGGNLGGTIPIAIDQNGDIAGTYYLNQNSQFHGFVYPSNGTITTFDVPGAGGSNNDWFMVGTVAIGIDSAGDVAGAYTDTSTLRHGFLRSASGTVSTFDAPGAGVVGICCGFEFEEGTAGVGINTAGEIAGAYLDADHVYHGFLRSASGGITTFEAPNAGSGTLQGSIAFGINTSGVIVGTYADTNYVLHGFIYTPALTSTTTTLTPAPTPNPSIYQEPVTLTASVSSSAGAPPNGENVTLMSGTTSLGTAQLTSGTASLTTTALPTGTDSITAVYGGDLNFAGSTSTAYSQTVNKASSSTTLKSSLNPSTFGQSVTFTANISGQFSGVATGTVTFNNGSTSLGSASVSSNSASLTTTTLPAGTDSITAVYSGDSNFAGSTSNTVSQVVNAAPNPVPLTSGISPAFTSAGGAAFTLTVNGSGFTSGSTVYWGTSALTTTYVSATQLTAQVPATDIVTGGITVDISVITPSPGGGTSNSFQFEVDSASGATTGPQFSSVTQTVTAGSPASYPVTLPSTVESASVTCLNLPTGATCSYSATTNAVTITTTSATPAGTYQITVIFTETVTGAATSWILLPILLLPLMLLRRKMAARGIWLTAFLGLVLIAAAAITAIGTGCGGGGSSSTTTPQTHQVTSSAVVTLKVQ